jgi:hypothetical protein
MLEEHLLANRPSKRREVDISRDQGWGANSIKLSANYSGDIAWMIRHRSFSNH